MPIQTLQALAYTCVLCEERGDNRFIKTATTKPQHNALNKKTLACTYIKIISFIQYQAYHPHNLPLNMHVKYR